MKPSWRLIVLFPSIALLGFAIERGGYGRVRNEVEAMSGAVVAILTLSLLRLYLQTESWSLALMKNGIDSNKIELMFLRLASQGVGYLTVLGPAISEPMKIKMLQRNGRSAIAATLVDTTLYWLSAGLVLLAGLAIAAFAVANNRAGSILLAATIGGGIWFLVQARTVPSPRVSALAPHSPGWLMRAAEIGRELQKFATANPVVIRRMFTLDLLCQALLLAEVATALRFLKLPATLGAVLSIEAAGRAARILGGFLPARIGADEGGATAAFIALGLPAASGLALALVRRFRDLLFSLAGLVWLGIRTYWVDHESTLRGIVECKL